MDHLIWVSQILSEVDAIIPFHRENNEFPRKRAGGRVRAMLSTVPGIQ